MYNKGNRFMKNLLHNTILKMTYYQLYSFVYEYKTRFYRAFIYDLSLNKRVLSILERYLTHLKRRDKIEVINEMNNRTLDKYIK